MRSPWSVAPACGCGGRDEALRGSAPAQAQQQHTVRSDMTNADDLIREIERQVDAGKSNADEILAEVRRSFPTATTDELLSACIALVFVMGGGFGNHGRRR